MIAEEAVVRKDAGFFVSAAYRSAMRKYVLAFALMLACSPAHEIEDGGGDAFVAPDTFAELDAFAGADANTCTDEGRFTCYGFTQQCCDGQWIEYTDGPCFPHDGGVPACATSPYEEGCPCTTENATQCRYFRSTVRCVGGVWTATDHACCPDHP